MKLKAAPVLKASTRLRKPVNTCSSPGASALLIADLVSWSRITTARLKPSQVHQRGAASGVGTRLARSEQVGDATPAQQRVRAVRSDVGAPMPAALAFRRGARVDRDRQRVAALDPRRRSD